ncbi:hypothetical protein TRE132_08600 [Pseudomonas chlororaphis subsp. aurantiaca]|nr:hypothetical protein TRE132_08600 [Pseudomonas chlororaphis subsp. aurantiaca]
MSADLIRLSDLAPKFASYHGVGLREAAYSLQELINDVYCIRVMLRGESLPEHVFWVGGAMSPERSIKGYELDFGGLQKYFKALIDSPEIVNPLVHCFCRAERDYADIPASVVYLSKSALSEWVLTAGIEPPEFILGLWADEHAKKNDKGGELKTKELNAIGKIVSGLIELVKEVHNAHAESAMGDEANRRAERIIKAASRLNSDRKNFCPYMAIISLADDAGIDMVKDHRTLERYAKGK